LTPKMAAEAKIEGLESSWQAQNSSYLYNNNFYQNYVSNTPKFVAVRFLNNGAFSTATITPMAQPKEEKDSQQPRCKTCKYCELCAAAEEAEKKKPVPSDV